MAKPNYQFEKRQRDLAKKQKQEDKRRQKQANKSTNAGIPQTDTPGDIAPQARNIEDSGAVTGCSEVPR